jgi:prepilin-type N-terminal cleavage/methylation domain-containing protein/prepilin-type processing-associated H-X9-DG protein
MMHHKGFTLVELLVVIGLIAVLIRILMPALNKVRQSAISLECQSNLRQIGIYARMYTYDEHGCLPIDGGAGQYHYWEISDKPWALRMKFPSKDGKNIPKILRCPVMWNALQPNKSEGSWTALSSYGLNMYMGGGVATGRTPATNNGVPNNGYPYTSLKIKQLKSYKYWFADGPFKPTYGHAAGSGWWDTGGMVSLNQSFEGSWPFPWGKPYKLEGHPNRSANFLMGDGHVENITYKEFRSWKNGPRSTQWEFTGQYKW